MPYLFSWIEECSYLKTYCKDAADADDLETTLRGQDLTFTKIKVDVIPEEFSEVKI